MLDAFLDDGRPRKLQRRSRSTRPGVRPNTPALQPEHRILMQMNMEAEVMTVRPIAAVIAVVIRDGQVLLVRRRNPPDAGRWGFPGGKIEFGETIAGAAVRELLEETGVRGEAHHVFTAVDAVDRDGDGRAREHFILVAVLCRWIAGEPMAGDDALEAC
jgi:8-oxo-dGTP diphosphatase